VAWCLLKPILGKELNQVLVVVDVVALLEAVMGSDNFTKSTTVWEGEFVGHSCAKLGISGMFSGERVIIVEECPRYIEVE
jgi:hypothetical protein